VSQELIDLVAELEPDAVELLVVLARRLKHGRALYGDLHVDSDRRNFIGEAFEEDADGLIYRAADAVRTMRRLRG